MASKLSPECWINIFHYIEARADLYSCLLVNRFLCKIIVKMLWKDPFSNMSPSKKFRSILETYLKCLSKQSIERMKDKGINLKIFNQKAMFRYPIFLRNLVIDSTRFDFFCEYYFIEELKNNNKLKNQLSYQKECEVAQIYSKVSIIFEEIIKLICDQSNMIRSLSVTPCKMIDYILPLLKKDKNCFQTIRTFTFSSTSTPYKIPEFIIALSQTSRDIKHLRINNVQQELIEPLEILVNSQNNLNSLELEQTILHHEPILSKLNSTRIISALSSLLFRNIDFSSITQRSLNSLMELSQNLKIFKVAFCTNCSSLFDVMRSCSNLIEFTYETFKFNDKDLEFLLSILKSSSNSLRYLDIFWINDSLLEKSMLIKCISEYCTKLITLKLRRLHSEDLFNIWYGCKQLEVLSFFCCEQSDWNDCMEDLGKILPCTLKVLKIGNWIEIPFSALALEGFLKGCKGSLKKLEIYSLKNLCEHSEHVHVLKNSGICYKIMDQK